jgi:hypothetical protein
MPNGRLTVRLVEGSGVVSSTEPLDFFIVRKNSQINTQKQSWFSFARGLVDYRLSSQVLTTHLFHLLAKLPNSSH